MDRQLAHPDECGFDARLSGTTACLALVAGDQVATANVGDSRAMIVRSAPGNRLQAVQLTQDAKPELPGVRALPLTLMLVRSASGNRLQAVRLTQDAKPELPGVRALTLTLPSDACAQRAAAPPAGGAADAGRQAGAAGGARTCACQMLSSHCVMAEQALF